MRVRMALTLTSTAARISAGASRSKVSSTITCSFHHARRAAGSG